MTELSRILGISRVTISKVLNERPGVSEDTRARVLKAVEELGFHPNVAARSEPPITVLLALADVMETYSRLQQHKIDIPTDLSLVGFDDHPAASYTQPPLTTLRQPLFEVGRHAVRKVTQMWDSDIKTLPNTLLPMELVIRGSCSHAAE